MAGPAAGSTRSRLTHNVTLAPSIDALRSLHSITSSARASTVPGTVRPRALAVLRLTTSSYLVGAWTGKSPASRP